MTFTMTAAYKEAMDFAPADEVYYDTLQFDCDGLTNPILIVNSYEPLVRAAGTFLPVIFEFTLPETAGGVRGQMTISVNGIPKAVRLAVRNVASSPYPVTATYRQYIGTSMTPDAYLPVPLSVSQVKETPLGFSVTATAPDLTGAYFPRRLMTTADFPGCRI